MMVIVMYHDNKDDNDDDDCGGGGGSGGGGRGGRGGRGGGGGGGGESKPCVRSCVRTNVTSPRLSLTAHTPWYARETRTGCHRPEGPGSSMTAPKQI